MNNNKELKQHIDTLNAQYGDALDRHDYDTWMDFFQTECLYLVQSRENFDRNLPLALIRLESQNMMRDRAYGCMDTIFHQLYYQRHIIGGTVIVSIERNNIFTRTNYSIFRTKPTSSTEVFNVGCYHDRWVDTDLGLKLAERKCVFDSEMVLNALIYPI
jgi:salicylate 5-hydroxylase small subunit